MLKFCRAVLRAIEKTVDEMKEFDNEAEKPIKKKSKKDNSEKKQKLRKSSRIRKTPVRYGFDE